MIDINDIFGELLQNKNEICDQCSIKSSQIYVTQKIIENNTFLSNGFKKRKIYVCQPCYRDYLIEIEAKARDEIFKICGF